MGRLSRRRVREDVAREVAELGHVGLATVLVGDDPASHVYIGAKHKAATEAGIDARDVRLPADTSEQHVLELVDRAQSPTTRSTGSSSSSPCRRTWTRRR